MTQALLIIDVQNDYFADGKLPLSNTNVALANTLKLQQYFRVQQLPIIYIQHIMQRPNATFFIAATIGADIHPDLLPIQANEQIIIKAYPNSFHQTQLDEALKQLGITQLVICGMMSHMCVDSTTRYATELGYQPIVIHDACTTKDLEFNGTIVEAAQVHHAFMAALTHFATVSATDHFIHQTV